MYFKFLFLSSSLILNLSSLMIQVIMIPVNQFWQRHKGISLVLQVLNQLIQRLRCEFRSIMAQNIWSASQMLMSGNCLNDGIHSVILPVQGIHIPLNRVISALSCDLDYRIIIVTIRRARTFSWTFISSSFFSASEIWLIFLWFSLWFPRSCPSARMALTSSG